MSITLDSILRSFPEVFTPDKTKLLFCYHMKLKEEAKPIVEPVRRVPFALKSKLKHLLDEMEAQGDLIRIDEPTEWIMPHVNVRKKDKLKIAMDTQKLAKFVERERYRMPTFEDIAAKLNGAVYYMVVDISHAFSKIWVDEETSKKLVIGTPFGRYRYLTLPYGLPSSSEILQRTMDTIFAGQQNVAIYADDIIVFGETETQHDAALIQLLETAKKVNLKLSEEKIQFKQKRIKYLGHIISNEGIAADFDKIRAIKYFPPPTN